MKEDNDISQQLAEAVKAAAQKRTPLTITGSGSKRFYAGDIEGEKLDVTGHRGIVSYEPTELVVTARAGTPLAELEAALADKGQMLAFEPPWFGEGATLGGTIACGFSGPRRPYAGAARDFVLGTRIINGKGEILRFGGEVMKNVAGYDVSRLMVGALGSLGVLLEVSLKVLPKPAREVTLCFEMPADKAIQTMNTWGAQPLPLSAACHAGETLYVRLSGTELGVQAARAKLGGKPMDKGNDFWREIREHRHSFFQNDVPLWRLSVPPAALPIDLPGKWLIDWGGAQRWLKSDASATDIRMQAEKAGGHATLFRHAKQNGATFHPLPAQLATLHQNLKRAFDPDGIMNRVVAV
ncbi:MAG: glycolate oxidase subunit GlcE [Candidatus Muproteobacteria bacterium RIFCSPHIGHO2_12_FULL_60_33]|uniref:Glycolate oxidase subunit GlcE n=1 Tax=Candidatus Muproteobacteria bacterium RIFCSPLOWO2_01_FULL_60_18 TaxID=1817768 RepID=A0A1F6U3Z0_9PROT|nr:MAG: glycolate oxidase subunit GlcE [Candidatus Muproteobacteria bacterium RIFCSPHIGHO2_01_60_12]OGI52095.1 MAG: glycolate oxidase subunit GlcE [Candidatus Muproteobacteria bacterium RIFCSPLOWO2_01_FULL_60_18]OGI55364.1 MAG: glycolate oxidase subunit GlcE [Candidatus Muproteobacteria bacterium RIFCSPHIGHO2_12_FULL_60_33]OGI58758.1 MAG: glycolate oxidase subunit GlcE [Candidatus Muproteobacteria bacterium RIFCSPHIGHO2_01_FULL_61_200]